jgi:hypothetical protein
MTSPLVGWRRRRGSPPAIDDRQTRPAPRPLREASPRETRSKAAGRRALQSVGSGEVTEVSAEGGDEAQPGAAQNAWDVEVTKAGGSAVEVHLDKRFNVLGAENDNEKGD